MKKLSKAAVALAIVASASATAHAADGPDGRIVKVSPDQESIYRLTYLNQGKSTVRVSILDEKGRPVFSETINSAKSFHRPYNLQNLNDGAYQFRIEDRAGVVTERVMVEKESDTAEAVVTRLAGDRYLLTLHGSTGNPVQVSIFDRFNRELHSETLKVQSGLSRVYNLSAVQDEHLLFEVSSDGQLIGKVKF